MTTAPFLDKDGATVNMELPLSPGRKAAAASRPVALSNEDAAFLDGIEGLLTTIDGRVDGLEGLITSTNTKLDTAITALQIIDNATFGAGAADAGTTRVTVDSGQMGALQTTDFVKSSGFVPNGLPTDQAVSNKVQSQSNGMTSSRVNAAGTTNATNLKAGAGAVGNIDVFNVAAYDVFLKFYNKASSPTVGTDTPVWTIPIKAGTGYARTFPFGKWLGTGISYAITKLQADSDTTAVVALDLTGSIDWI